MEGGDGHLDRGTISTRFNAEEEEEHNISEERDDDTWFGDFFYDRRPRAVPNGAGLAWAELQGSGP